MGIQQKIMFAFLLMTGFVNGQEKTKFYQPALLRASATIAPTRFYHQNTTVAFINGFLEYVIEDKISVRGEGMVMAPNGKLLFTNEPERFPRNYTGLYAGFGYHFGKNNWKFNLYAQPGVGIAEVAQDPYFIVPIQYQWNVCPTYMLKAGTAYYFSKFCHFYLELNFGDGWARKTPWSSISLAQYGISAGLGFHVLTNKKQK